MDRNSFKLNLIAYSNDDQFCEKFKIITYPSVMYRIKNDLGLTSFNEAQFSLCEKVDGLSSLGYKFF
jgi:hypothetical protein